MLPTKNDPTQSHPQQPARVDSRLNLRINSQPYLPPSTATEKGHMIRTRQGLRSTRSVREQMLEARQIVDDMQPQQEACTAINDEIFCFAALAD